MEKKSLRKILQNEKRKNAGITLIALVITIVVLVILATVTINFAFGENGLVTMTETARAESEKDAIIEQIQLDIVDKEIENQGSINTDKFRKILMQYGTISEEGSKLITSKGNYEILISDIYQEKLTNAEITLPNSLNTDFFEQVKISQTINSNYTTDFDVATLKNQSKNIYYVSPNGNDSRSGLSREEALLSLTKALELCESGDTIMLLEGMYTRTNWPSGTSNNDIKKSVNIIGENNNVYVKQGDNHVYTQNEQFPNIYQTTRNKVWQVIDITNINIGEVEQLEEVYSLEDCNNTESSYYCDGTITYINMRGETIPTNENLVINLILDTSTIRVYDINDNIKLYLEGITIIGGKGNISAYANSNYTPTILAKNCKFYASKTSEELDLSAVNMRGCYSVFQNCEAKFGNNDGFNYHNQSGKICNAIEIGCIGANNGEGWKDYTCNGSTIHDGGKIIRLNGEYYNNYGGNVADVNEDTVSLNLGCYAHDSYSGIGGANSTDFVAQLSGAVMYLYSCKSDGTSEYNICSIEGTTIYVKDCVYDTIYKGGNVIEE